MTTSAPRRLSAAWLLAPLTAGGFALAAGWAVQDDPANATRPSAHAAPVGTSRLQQRAELAARRLQRSQTLLVRLESSVRQRSAQVSLLETDVRTAAEARRRGRVAPPVSVGAAPAPPAPAPVAVPPAPPVQTTTGAS